jgi:hypothetical protein
MVAGSGYEELTAESQTRGGLNEQAVRQLRDSGAYEHWTSALDSVQTRLTGG